MTTIRPGKRRVALSCAFAFILLAIPIWGQGLSPSVRAGNPNETIGAPTASSSLGGSGWTLPTDLGPVTQSSSANPDLFRQVEDGEDETCLPWTASAVVGSTVSVVRLR